MADFLQSLRMANVLGPNGTASTFQPPNFNSGGINPDAISAIMNRITPFISSEKQKDRNLALNLHGMENPDGMSTRPLGTPQLSNVAHSMMQPPSATPPQNVVFKDNELTPFQKATLVQKSQELNEKKNEAGGKLGLGYDKLSADTNVKQQRADSYDWKNKHPNALLMKPKGGDAYLIDPITHEKFDTGIPTGSLTDSDRIKLEGAQKIEQIGAKGDETRKNINLRGDVRIKEIGAQGDQARQTKGTPGAQSQLPTQQKVDQLNKANQLMNSDPELRSFVHIDPDTKQITIDQPSMDGSSGPTMDQFARIKAKVYGGREPGDINLPKEYNNKPDASPNPKDDAAFKVQATEILKNNGSPITDANIQHVIDKLKALKPQSDENENDNNDNESEE